MDSTTAWNSHLCGICNTVLSAWEKKCRLEIVIAHPSAVVLCRDWNFIPLQWGRSESPDAHEQLIVAMCDLTISGIALATTYIKSAKKFVSIYLPATWIHCIRHGNLEIRKWAPGQTIFVGWNNVDVYDFLKKMRNIQSLLACKLKTRAVVYPLCLFRCAIVCCWSVASSATRVRAFLPHNAFAVYCFDCISDMFFYSNVHVYFTGIGDRMYRNVQRVQEPFFTMVYKRIDETE